MSTYKRVMQEALSLVSRETDRIIVASILGGLTQE